MSIISTKYLLQDAQANGYAVPALTFITPTIGDPRSVQ